MSTGTRASWLGAIALGVFLGGLALFLFVRSRDTLPGVSSQGAVASLDGTPPDVASPPPASIDRPQSDDEAGGDEGLLSAVGIDPDTEAAMRWATVDLDEVREALPDNLYWKMSAPTDDPDVLRWREEERARWNVEYGKVLSGNATEEEIHDYFDLRQRVSQDAVSFAEYLLLNHGSTLPERDVSLLNLASRLHRARLEEMPRRLAEALARKERQDRLREAWIADEKAFEEAQRGGD